jgi:hypothetical protein
MTRKEIREQYGDSIMLMDGYDECIVGVCERFGQAPFVMYDQEKVIQSLCKEMSRDEAIEFMDFNQKGAWVGEHTPGFLING